MSSTPSSTDRIEEQVLLHASRARVWRALTDPREFGAWFGVRLPDDATFTPGATVRGQLTYPGYEHVTLEITIADVVPESRFAWRWHPNATDPAADYSAEPLTLCTFTLEDAPNDSTLVRLVESGFDALPPSRRASAFASNARGWTSQMKRIAQYLAA